MKIKFKAFFDNILKVEIEKESESSIWEKGQKTSSRKVNSYVCYCDTFEEAKNFIKEKVLKEIKSSELSIEYHKQRLLKIESLQEPK